jgi:hypothetical protein
MMGVGEDECGASGKTGVSELHTCYLLSAVWEEGSETGAAGADHAASSEAP